MPETEDVNKLFVETGGGIKAGFDNRTGRNYVLTHLLIDLVSNMKFEDAKEWLKSLQALYWFCYAYIKEDDAKDLRKKLISIKKQIRFINSTSGEKSWLYTNVIDDLEEVTTLCFKLFRDQLLSAKSEEEDFTEESFLKGSGLL